MMTVEYHQRYAQAHIADAIKLIADVDAPRRQCLAERPDWTDLSVHYTIGYLTQTVAGLLDALGYPEHGPNVDQHAWLPFIDRPYVDADALNDDEEEDE